MVMDTALTARFMRSEPEQAFELQPLWHQFMIIEKAVANNADIAKTVLPMLRLLKLGKQKARTARTFLIAALSAPTMPSRADIFCMLDIIEDCERSGTP